MTDLAVVVADVQAEHALDALLSRPRDLHLGAFTFSITVHPERDPGCRLTSQELLRPMIRSRDRCLVIYDRHGCGREDSAVSVLEDGTRDLLRRNGWAGRSEVVVIDPELEIWVWVDSPVVDACVGWRRELLGIRRWLRQSGHWPAGAAKPPDPKGALETALREVQRPRSSSLFRQLGASAPLAECADPAFNRFTAILQAWFPP